MFPTAPLVRLRLLGAMMLTRAQDAYGRLIYDFHRGLATTEIAERDDGWIAESGGARDYRMAGPTYIAVLCKVEA